MSASDPNRPVRRIYRWDLDKTYLQTDFDTFRQLVRTAFQKAHQKKAVPGAAALIRELRASGDSRLCIVSGSPTQMRTVLTEKLKLDGVEFDELVLKDNLRNLVRGRFKAMRGQVGYKLPVLLESRARAPVGAEEVLFGDDAEADAFIYSLYADMVARRVSEPVVHQVLEAAEVYSDDIERVIRQWKDPAGRSRAEDLHQPGSPDAPAAFARYGPRVVPIFNYFQPAWCCWATGTSPPLRYRVMFEMADSRLQPADARTPHLLRRGLPIADVGEALVEALQGPALQVMRPVPDIIAAFSKRVAALGAQPPPPKVREIDYLALLDDARPRTHQRRRRSE